jgi:uncharacterized protein
MSRSFKLYRLQQIDNQLDKIQKRLAEILAALENDHALHQASEKKQKAEEKQNAAFKALQKAEANVLEQHIKIEQSEAALYGGKVRNPKELQDIQNEVSSLKRYLAVLEDRQLEAMVEEEEAAAELEMALKNMQKLKQEFMEKSSELIEERTKLNADVARLAGEHQAAANTIPAEDIKLYTNLRESRRGIAVSKVVDKTCSSCGSTINASLLHAARSPTQINTCDVCGRILYTG